MPRTPLEALNVIRAQSAHGPAVEVGTCLMQVHDAYGIPSDGTPSAAEAWSRAKYKHPTSDPTKAPFGALHFWTGGSHGFGHIAFAAFAAAQCWSTDILRPGFFDRVPVTQIHDVWGLTYVGWTEDVDGVRVITYAPPSKPAPVVPPSLPPTKVTEARHLLGEALATAGPIRRLRIRAGLVQIPKR